MRTQGIELNPQNVAKIVASTPFTEATLIQLLVTNVYSVVVKDGDSVYIVPRKLVTTFGFGPESSPANGWTHIILK